MSARPTTTPIAARTSQVVPLAGPLCGPGTSPLRGGHPRSLGTSALSGAHARSPVGVCTVVSAPQGAGGPPSHPWAPLLHGPRRIGLCSSRISFQVCSSMQYSRQAYRAAAPPQGRPEPPQSLVVASVLVLIAFSMRHLLIAFFTRPNEKLQELDDQSSTVSPAERWATQKIAAATTGRTDGVEADLGRVIYCAQLAQNQQDDPSYMQG
eukprot:gene5558-4194_t